MDWEESPSSLSSPQSKRRASPQRSPLLPPPPPSSHSQSPQSSSSISGALAISAIASSSPLELTGPKSSKNEVVSTIIVSSTTSSLSLTVTEASSKLDHHRHRHLQPQQFHSQKFSPTSNSTTTRTSPTIIADEDDSSCGAVDLVSTNKTRNDQPEELVVTASSSSSLSTFASSSIAGQQKLNQLQGVPSSSAPTSISSSTLLLRRRSRHAEVVEEETQDNPTDLTTKTNTTATTTSQQHLKNSRNLQQECGGGGSGSSAEKSLSIKRSKIPPPLDLRIGANLSLHHHYTSNTNTNHNHSYSISSSNSNNNNGSTSTNAAPLHQSNNHQQNHNPQQLPTSPTYLGSPKFDNKNLPIRKRYQQWSPPTQMNGQEHAEGAASTSASSTSSSMMPLYSDSQQHNNPLASKTGLAGVGNAAGVTTSGGDNNNGTSPGSAGLYNNRSWVLDMVPQSAPPITTSSRLNHHHHHHGISLASSNSTNSSSNSNNTSSTNSIPNSLGLHTPTPFFTPNEPSPKFMNSPVFTYSNPDAPLYNGPFSPIRHSSLYPPPSSPFTNLSLNSPLPPLQSSVSSNSSSISSNSSSSSTSSTNNSTSSGGATPANAGGGGMVGNTCFNMIPSTLLSPAPSQASTNSLSYEDLHEKSLSLFTPVWSIFMPGTKVRFVAMNSMDWYLADFLAQSGDSLLGLKGEYAPHGLELRKLVMTSSPKERVQLTFCPVADPNHPTIEVNCEPGHPFMVDKKGWCAVKPEVFQETYGTPCQPLEGGDICLNLNAARSPNNNVISMNNNHAAFLHQQQQQHQSLLHHTAGFVIHGSPNNVVSSVSSAANLINNNSIINTSGVALANMHNLSQLHSGNNANNNNNSLVNSPMGSLMAHSIKMEPIDEKPIPISVLPQNQHGGLSTMQIMQSPPPPPLQHQPGHHLTHPRNAGGSGTGNSRKTYAAVPMSAPGSPAKRAKDGHGKDSSHTGDQPAKGRRPMNAFLLFAKDKRPELIQKYPGKDNRTISVLLGEAWQKLAAPERERYALNAKARAEEQKRIHPDCWKRKRSQSTSS